MIVGDDESTPWRPAPAQLDKEVFPGGANFPVGHFDGQDLASPVPVMPMAIRAAWLITAPGIVTSTVFTVHYLLRGWTRNQ